MSRIREAIRRSAEGLDTRAWSRLSCALICLGSTAGFWGPQAYAAPEEIVVFADEFEKPGKWGYELHVNYANRTRRTPDYPGEQPPDRILRVMPEVVWGLSKKWNLGLHLPGSRNGYTGTVTVDGFKARIHFLDAGEAATGNAFLGANCELSFFDRRLSESGVVAEARAIVGMRSRDWLFAINPILSRPLRPVSGVDNSANLDVSAKAMKSFGRDMAAGLEHYSGFGKFRDPTIGSRSGQSTFLVLEWATRSHFEFHFGFGHGWTSSVDKRVYKMMVGLPF